MAERSNAAVLKTVDCNRSGGSNPSLSASARRCTKCKGGLLFFCLTKFRRASADGVSNDSHIGVFIFVCHSTDFVIQKNPFYSRWFYTSKGRLSCWILRCMYYVYILLCADRKYYVGSTQDFKERMSRHRRGDVKYTSSRLPVDVNQSLLFRTYTSRYASKII